MEVVISFVLEQAEAQGRDPWDLTPSWFKKTIERNVGIVGRVCLTCGKKCGSVKKLRTHIQRACGPLSLGRKKKSKRRARELQEKMRRFEEEGTHIPPSMTRAYARHRLAVALLIRVFSRRQ